MERENDSKSRELIWSRGFIYIYRAKGMIFNINREGNNIHISSWENKMKSRKII